MGTQRNYTSSGSKSRDTRGAEPSQEDVRDELKGEVDDDGGAEARTTGTDARGTPALGQRGTPGRDLHR